MVAASAASCCADVYGSDLVALLLGDSYHPGGLPLTRRLARLLGLRRDEHVLDLACGRGSTALLLAEEFGARVSGLDLSAANVALAQGRLTTAERVRQVSFELADAEQLPHPDAAFDAVVIECALCTFSDKARVATEIVRVLRPGGRLGLTDVVAEPDQLPPELTTVAARIACVAGALSMNGYCDVLEAAGLRVRRIERHDLALLRMLDQIDARLALARLTAHGQAKQLGLDLDRAGLIMTAARAAATTGTIGYGLLVAERPA
jgi:cyclopropane fatty-acyl-phospholipid synthase-like methyltransferase